MISWRAKNCGLALLYIPAAPLLLFAAMLMVLTSKLALLIFGQDPVGELAERHPEAWAILNLTGRCTLGLLLVGLLFLRAF
jgi:hypothetical protein